MVEINSLKNQIKNRVFNLYWYSKESSILTLPFKLVSVAIWLIAAKILAKFIKKENMKLPVIAFTSIYYNGNARGVYEYMIKNKSEKFFCYWIARNTRSLKDVRREGGEAFILYFPFTGAKYLLNTDVLVTNDSYLSFLFPRKPKMIQLWHGEGGKGTGKSDIEMCDVRCLPSAYLKQRYIELWNVPPEKLYVTGYARMDFLYNYLKMPKEKLLKDIGITKSERKIILYAPTFDVGLWPWGNPYEEFEKLCKFCNKNGLILILRLHPLAKINKWKLKKLIKKYKNVYWMDMKKEPDTMKLLAIADILITSWSSIDNEYFLTKRPIIYLEANPGYFAKSRGKMKISLKYRAGEIAHNNEEFYKALNIILKEGNRYKEKQEEFLKLIHGKVDGKASERVVEVIERLLRD